MKISDPLGAILADTSGINSRQFVLDCGVRQESDNDCTEIRAYTRETQDQPWVLLSTVKSSDELYHQLYKTTLAAEKEFGKKAIKRKNYVDSFSEDGPIPHCMFGNYRCTPRTPYEIVTYPYDFSYMVGYTVVAAVADIFYAPGQLIFRPFDSTVIAEEASVADVAKSGIVDLFDQTKTNETRVVDVDYLDKLALIFKGGNVEVSE